MTTQILPKLPPRLGNQKPFKSVMDRGKQKLNETSLNEPSASTINYNNANDGAEN